MTRDKDRSPKGRDGEAGSVGDESLGRKASPTFVDSIPNPLIGKGEVVQADEIERVALAMEEATPGHHIQLVGLADGVSTYRATVGDEEPREFVGVDAYSQASHYVERFTKIARTRAAIAALHDHRLTAQPVTVASPGYEAGLAERVAMRPPPADWVPTPIEGVDPADMTAWAPPAEGRREVEQQIAAWLASGFHDFPDAYAIEIADAIERGDYRPTTEGERR